MLILYNLKTKIKNIRNIFSKIYYTWKTFPEIPWNFYIWKETQIFQYSCEDTRIYFQGRIGAISALPTSDWGSLKSGDQGDKLTSNNFPSWLWLWRMTNVYYTILKVNDTLLIHSVCLASIHFLFRANQETPFKQTMDLVL